MSTTWLAESQEHRIHAEHLRQLLLRNAELREARSANQQLAARVDQLRSWRATHITALVPPGRAERAAGDLLIDQLLAARNFEARDRQLESAFPALARVARGSLLRGVADAVELHVLLQEFDHRVVETIFDTMGQCDLSERAIGEANRLINDYRRRMRQVELLRLTCKRLAGLARSRSARLALTTARLAARPFATHLPIDTLARGVQAFAALPDAQAFTRAFVRAQTDLIDSVHAGADPFDAAPPDIVAAGALD